MQISKWGVGRTKQLPSHSVVMSSNLIYFAQKEPIEVKFSDFWVVGWKFMKFPMSCVKPQVNFSLNLASLYFFSCNFMWFWQKGPIKVKCFRLLTAHMKFHQICTLVGSLCWNYIKFQLKSTERLCLMTLKSDAKFEEKRLLFQKWQEFGEFLPEHLNVSKTCSLIGSFCAKYIMFDLKK